MLTSAKISKYLEGLVIAQGPAGLVRNSRSCPGKGEFLSGAFSARRCDSAALTIGRGQWKEHTSGRGLGGVD